MTAYQDILRTIEEVRAIPKPVGDFLTVHPVVYPMVRNEIEKYYSGKDWLLALSAPIIHVDGRCLPNAVYASDEPIADDVGSIHEVGSPEWLVEKVRRNDLFQKAHTIALAKQRFAQAQD